MDYKFDAFISYRHCDLDKFVAENLHKLLETYKPPKSALKKSNRKSIKRVFRDQEELPLTSNLEDPIIDALKQSEYLIVICSPRLKDSAWCRKEIETFISMHGRDKVLAILIEGEPDESFPEEILKGEERTIYENGVPRIIFEKCEPLAADFRGKDKNEVKKKMKKEVLRLMAPMFNVDFDDLRQRHKERRMRKIITWSLSIATLTMCFSIYCVFTSLKIKKQYNEIQAQSETISKQSSEVMKKSALISDQNDVLLKFQTNTLANNALDYLNKDDRINALKYSIYACSEYENQKMPYSSKAYNSLINATRYYSGEYEKRAITNVEMPANVHDIKLSDDLNYVMATDIVGNLIVHKTEDLSEVYRTFCNGFQGYVCDFYGFVDSETIYYVSRDESAQIYFVSLLTGDVINEIVLDDDEYALNYSKIVVSPDKKTIAVGGYPYYKKAEDGCYSKIYFYDLDSYEKLNEIYTSSYNDNLDNIIFIDNSTILISECMKHQFDETTDHSLVLYDFNIGKVISSYSDDYYELLDYALGGDKLYFSVSVWDSVICLDSEIHCLDLKKDQLTKIDNIAGNTIDKLIYNNGYILAATKIGASVYDCIDNSLYINANTESMIAGTNFDDNNFYLYEKDGSIDFINLTNKTFISFDSVNCATFDKVYKVNECFIGIPEYSKIISLYGYESNTNKTEYHEQVIDIEDNISLYDDEYDNVVKSSNIINTDLIQCIYKYDDLNIFLVEYVDYKCEVYNTNSYEKMHEFYTDGNYFYKFYGNDDFGNYYFGGKDGIILDKNWEVLGYIPNFDYLDNSQQLVIQFSYYEDNNKKFYATPILSMEQLVDYGKDILQKYEY